MGTTHRVPSLHAPRDSDLGCPSSRSRTARQPKRVVLGRARSRRVRRGWRGAPLLGGRAGYERPGLAARHQSLRRGHEARDEQGLRPCFNTSRLPHVGSSVDSWLRDEGIYEQTTASAIKRVLARQVEQAMKEQNVSKSEMAKRMHTSRAALDRLLDPGNDAVTLSTLQKAATAIGREIRLELV